MPSLFEFPRLAPIAECVFADAKVLGRFSDPQVVIQSCHLKTRLIDGVGLQKREYTKHYQANVLGAQMASWAIALVVGTI